jgi:uroporphyrinogen-III synthase
VAGTEVAGDLSATLTKAGFAVDRAVLYAAQAVDGLSEALSQSLRAGAVTVGLFYSPRTARIFAERIQAVGLGWAVKSMTALALSPAVAAALAPLGLDRVVVADHPTQDALFAALDRTPFPAD